VIEEHKEMQGVLEKMYHERGFDFREYRDTTLTRRLGRRLRATGAETYADYTRVLDQDPAEYQRLFEDLTINVTSFFRDQVAFKALKEAVLPTLINRGINRWKCLRIWSAGCATGEESYSIAMLLLEHLGEHISRWNVTILASDIDAKVLQRAREGVFAEVQGIRPAWRDRYLTAEGDSFSVRPALRRLVTFQRHNLVSDPPYFDLDLVVCRNVLIYFKPPLQMRVLKGFHQGLKEGGFLLLGKSEVPLGQKETFFHCLDSKARLYQKGK